MNFVDKVALGASPSAGQQNPISAVPRRRILILEFDLFNNVGGGQTAYRRIIQHDSNSHYYYLTRNERPSGSRPGNAFGLPAQDHYQANLKDLPAEMEHFYREYVDCWNIAYCVAKALGPFHFDIVDVPDYSDRSLFIRGALSQHKISVGRVAIALHGTLETPAQDWWPVPKNFSRRVAELRTHVHLQYRAADVRYAISSAYAKKWAAYTGIEANAIDPLIMMGSNIQPTAVHTIKPPGIIFAGRLERWKGPDIFIDLVWALKDGSVENIRVFGPEHIGPSGVSSNQVLKDMALRRGISVDIAGGRSQQELIDAFEARNIVVVSSRHDTFNLVALEALTRGCPTFVSRTAGVAEWILSNYPALSDLVVDFECSRAAAASIRDAVENYDATRARIIEALSKKPIRPNWKSLDRAYAGPYLSDPKAQQTLADLQSRFDSFNRPIPRGASVTAPLDLQQLMPSLDKADATKERRQRPVTPRLFRVVRQTRPPRLENERSRRGGRRISDIDAAERIRMSGLFDEVFYCISNPDVAESGVDPVQHFLEEGADELRNPNPLFDTAWYQAEYPDVSEAGANPLLHYLTSGAAEGRDPNPLFHSRWYLERNRDVAAAGLNPLRHYLNAGSAELRDPNPLFNSRWYLRRYPTLVEEGVNLLHHFLLLGAAEDADPHPLFKTSWYRRHNQEAIGTDNPLAHFLLRGGREGRSPHPLFDCRWYLSTYPDVAQTGLNPLLHYLRRGASEGRDPHPDFDSDAYMALHSETGKARTNPLVHFVSELSDTSAPAFVQRNPSVLGDKASSVPDTAQWAAQISGMDRIREQLLQQPERTHAEIRQKLHDVAANVVGVKIGRAAAYRDMARLARKGGMDLIAATYCLRLMRWLGRDYYGDLPFVIDTLKRNNHSAEAETAAAMYGDVDLAESRCLAIIDGQARAHRAKPDLPLSAFDDRRNGADVAVSVIVSLYNAESKLPTMLANLAMQSLVKHRKLEIILIDSNSPTKERRVFEQFASANAIPIVYARSEKRETIQAAWNRGIKIARAPYLSFIGVDEGLHPDCLEILASSLDAKPNVDWVIANSLITEVDHHGKFVRDVMPYERAGYRQQLVQLETCYLSWVGGLYRKSIHERFGYYDETFRAAGDTEFKSRILPHIQTLHIPKLLGIFNNYPDDRTTQSPLAELEDLRAWYLHRTPAGIAYAFKNKPVEEVQDLFKSCLRYRKSYCTHASTDIDMAASVSEYLSSRGETETFARDAKLTAKRLLACMRAVEMLDFCSPAPLRTATMAHLMQTFRGLQAMDAAAFDLERKPNYELFNDNRFEQHWWPW